MIDEVRLVTYPPGMGSVVSAQPSPVPEKIRTAEAWRQLGAKLRKLDREKYEAIFAAIVAELDKIDVTMLESYHLT